ncbi:YfcC family protein [Virgibacillus sediminis]|uniref:YfcC family protein n=1 Tax=Virgibacillus sediminis TaxID=202260 RepID=A0ABV7A4X7_9BACI
MGIRKQRETDDVAEREESKLENVITKVRMPHVYVILMSLLILSYIATLLIPSGSFEREERPGGMLVVPESFQFIDAEMLTPFDLLFAIPTGMVQAGELIFGGIMIGGLFAVVEKTGLLNIVIHYVFKIFQAKKILVIPALMIPMGIFTTITGAFEMALIYIPALIPVILRLGYDRFTAFAIVIVSCSAGLSVALTAPATVGLAQTISELPLYSGIGLRVIVMSLVLLVGIWYVWRYARKIERDPSKGYLYGDGLDGEYLDDNEPDLEKISTRQLAGLIFLFAGLGVMVYGLLVWGWYFIEIGGWYAFMGIVLGLICKMTPSGIAETFNEGFKKFIVAGIVIGLARSISVILENGQILDTIIYGISEIVSSMPAEISAVMMMIAQASFNFVVGSGSGQALITMPIMVGLSDLLDVTRQTSVLAFQFGDGFSNIIYPTGLIMAFLAFARISYVKWLRFIIPLVLIWYGISTVTLIIAQSIGWG